MSTNQKEFKNGEEKLRAYLWENLPGFGHSNVFVGNFNKERIASRSKLHVFVGFLIGGMGSIWNSDCRFCVTEEENLERLISNFTTIAAICASHHIRERITDSCNPKTDDFKEC